MGLGICASHRSAVAGAGVDFVEELFFMDVKMLDFFRGRIADAWKRYRLRNLWVRVVCLWRRIIMHSVVHVL